MAPDAFPAGVVYDALIWPEVIFVPLYVAAAALLWRRHWLGSVLAFVAGGGIVYVMIYLLALSGLSGTVNLVADGLFLACTLAALWQVGAPRPSRHRRLTMESDTSNRGQDVRYEPDERPPLPLTLGLGLQYAVLTVTSVVLTPAILIGTVAAARRTCPG